MPCSSVISRAPGLKLVVETLMSSLKPIGNIVVICCAFFIIFGILGVQVRGKGQSTNLYQYSPCPWSSLSSCLSFISLLMSINHLSKYSQATLLA
ncbi:Voltage-dependent T-type calcium channel subunit alpha-1G, partial [Goodea atripinnis]